MFQQHQGAYNQFVQESCDTVNMSNINVSQIYHTKSNKQGANGSIGWHQNNWRCFKDMIKLYVQMMIEDIWSNFEGFSW